MTNQNLTINLAAKTRHHYLSLGPTPAPASHTWICKASPREPTRQGCQVVGLLAMVTPQSAELSVDMKHRGLVRACSGCDSN